jgi:hypothetical protein
MEVNNSNLIFNINDDSNLIYKLILFINNFALFISFDVTVIIKFKFL